MPRGFSLVKPFAELFSQLFQNRFVGPRCQRPWSRIQVGFAQGCLRILSYPVLPSRSKSVPFIAYSANGGVNNHIGMYVRPHQRTKCAHLKSATLTVSAHHESE